MSQIMPFHLAFKVNDLQAARRFYGEVLGCPEGRSSETWIDVCGRGQGCRDAGYGGPSAA